MSKREERERARMMAMLPDEGAVAVEIFETASKLGEPGDVISPELAELASQVAGAEAATRWLKAGRSMDDCGTVRRFYEYVGQQIAADVGPGGRLNGATTSGADDDEDAAPAPERHSQTAARGIRFEPALDSEPTALIGTAGGGGSLLEGGTFPVIQELDKDRRDVGAESLPGGGRARAAFHGQELFRVRGGVQGRHRLRASRGQGPQHGH